jgi:hypothetical protein
VLADLDADGAGEPGRDHLVDACSP